jgi:bisanhydrobacterioruberin hydratase
MNAHLSMAWRIYGRTVAFALVILFGVGAIGHAFPRTEPLMRLLTPGFGLLTSLLVVAPALAAGGRGFALWAAGTYAFTFLAEVAGVATGSVFGEYEYGVTMGWAWHGVPVLIALNWVMVVHGAFCLSRRWVPLELGLWRRPATAVLAAGLAVGFDFIMEPVAMRLDYWRWPGNVVPLQNYAAWFLIALLAAAVHPRPLCRPGQICSAGRLAGFYVVLQALFFGVLRLVWRFGPA